MSFNSYATMTPEMQSAIAQIADSRIAQKSSKTIWRNPVTEQYYYANDPTSTKPDYGIPITKPGKLKGIDRSRYNKPTSQQMLGASSNPNISSNEADKMRYDIFTDEASNDAVMFYDQMDRLRKSYYQTGDESRFIGGGTITAQDYPGISNVMIDQQMLELITRDFIILDAVTTKSWDKLVYTFDNITPYRNVGDLGELDISPPRSVSYARGTINLKKAQGHVSVSIWAGMSIRDHDGAADSQRIIDADFPRIFATEVSSMLSGFANQATSGAYDIIAGGAFHSTTNPSVRFDADSASIRTAGGKADTLVMNTQTYRALIGNTYMRLSGNPTLSLGQPIEGVHAFSTSHQLLPGYRIFVDELAPDDNIIDFDRRSPIFLEGPTSMRNIELAYGQIKDTVSDRWYGSGIKVAAWGVEQTNIHS
jgi:hypothetical protein